MHETTLLAIRCFLVLIAVPILSLIWMFTTTRPSSSMRQRPLRSQRISSSTVISEDQLFYCNQRGIPTEQAVGLIVNGYAKEVLQKLPMEFAVEAQKLLSVSLEGTVG